MRQTYQRTILFLWFCAFFLATSLAQEWTRFRGPNGTGVSPAKGIPTQWTEADYNWKVALPGIGHSQPVLWGDKIFVTSAPVDGSARVVSCLSTSDGRTLWTKEYQSEFYKTHKFNNLASSTPVVDGERVYVAFAHPKEVFLVALDHSGKEVWKQSGGGFVAPHGFAASPMIFEDTVILPKEVSDTGEKLGIHSYVLALDRATGEVRWKTPRRSNKAAYATACIYEHEKGKPELLLSSKAHGVYSLDARTGTPIWEAGAFEKRSASSVAVGDGVIFGTCGSGGGGNYIVAVRPGGKGNVSQTHVAYTIRRSAPYVPTTLAKGDRAYFWSDKGGIVTSVKSATGEVIWRGRANGNFFGSPVWIEGRIFCIAAEGEVVVIGTGDTFEVLARNDLGEKSHSTPAIAGGRMYLRTERHLISVGGTEHSVSEGSVEEAGQKD